MAISPTTDCLQAPQSIDMSSTDTAFRKIFSLYMPASASKRRKEIGQPPLHIWLLVTVAHANCKTQGSSAAADYSNSTVSPLPLIAAILLPLSVRTVALLYSGWQCPLHYPCYQPPFLQAFINWEPCWAEYSPCVLNRKEWSSRASRKDKAQMQMLRKRNVQPGEKCKADRSRKISFSTRNFSYMVSNYWV